jgi:hypothetical protein
MNERDLIPLDADDGHRTPTSGGDRLMLLLAAVALAGGLAIAFGNLIDRGCIHRGHGDGRAKSHPETLAYSSAARSDPGDPRRSARQRDSALAERSMDSRAAGSPDSPFASAGCECDRAGGRWCGGAYPDDRRRARGTWLAVRR